MLRRLAVVPLAVAFPVVALFHLRLSRTEPAANAAVAAPAALKLWFTQRPELGVTTVRLLDARGTAVPTGALARAADAGAPIVVPVARPLAPGRYSVRWRTMARDGHVVDGGWSFTVTAAAPRPAR